MTAPTGDTGTPLLNEWIAEAGEEQVLSAVRDARRLVESGDTPGFTDPEAMLAYLGRRAAE